MLPASATVIGAIVLAQILTFQDVAGVSLAMLGIAMHQPEEQRAEAA